MDPGHPPSLLGRLTFLLGKLHARGLEVEAAALAGADLDVKQHAVLTVLADEGAMTQQDMAQRLGIDRTTIVSVVDGLEERGRVERRRSPADRRAYLLTLTAAGHRAREDGSRQVAGAERAVLGSLDAEERRTLVDLLRRALGDR